MRFLLAIVSTLILCSAPYSVRAQEETPSPEESLALLWEQIDDQPDDVAIGCVPLTAPEQAVLYNADQSFPLASVTKLILFIEYARRLDSGAIRLSEMVDVALVNRYNLPRTDRGAHDRFMAQYPADIREIPLWELALGMVQYSSNAASDYILDLLEPVDWAELYSLLSLNNTDYPHSLTMIPLLMNNHVTGNATLRDLNSLSRVQGETYLDLYVNDSAWRAAEIEYRSRRGRQFPAWNVQSAILAQDTASGSVADLLTVLQAIYTENGVLNANVKSLVRRALRWRDNEYIDEHYLEYGSKLGFYSGGTLTLVAYGDPYLGDPVISAVFFREIPRSRYTDLLEDDAIGTFAHWLNFNGCAGLRERLPS